VTTAFGALLAHITGGHRYADEPGKRSFQPMNVNFGLFPPIEVPKGKRAERGAAKKRALSARALADLDAWLGDGKRIAAE
jgi:methylenetetrahydrofolate--tRNA-(uracil-5-)-methyltransferase